MKCVFTGVAAFLGRIHDATRCAFWADDPTEHGFDPSRLIEIDLARTPSAAMDERIGWTDVDVDDCFSGPTGNVIGSTLGPQWPEIQIVGMVWLEDRFLRGLPDHLRPPCPPVDMEGHAYEFQSVVYWPGSGDPRGGARYLGHHAKILEERGTLARVAVYPVGSSMRPDARPTLMWIDLASSEQCDAGPGGLTQIGVGERTKEGALFLALNSLQPRD